MDIVNAPRGNENIECENVVRISGSEGSLEDSFMDVGLSFMDGTVGTYSNHGIEITGDEEVRGRTRSSTWKSARSGSAIVFRCKRSTRTGAALSIPCWTMTKRCSASLTGTGRVRSAQHRSFRTAADGSHVRRWFRDRRSLDDSHAHLGG